MSYRVVILHMLKYYSQRIILYTHYIEADLLRCNYADTDWVVFWISFSFYYQEDLVNAQPTHNLKDELFILLYFYFIFSCLRAAGSAHFLRKHSAKPKTIFHCLTWAGSSVATCPDPRADCHREQARRGSSSHVRIGQQPGSCLVFTFSWIYSPAEVFYGKTHKTEGGRRGLKPPWTLRAEIMARILRLIAHVVSALSLGLLLSEGALQMDTPVPTCEKVSSFTSNWPIWSVFNWYLLFD